MTPVSEAGRLALFGGFRLTEPGGQEIAISSRKNRALLAILALAPGCAATRDQLVALLWGDRGEQQARNSLRQALVALRRDLAEIEPSPLVIQDDQVKVDLACLRIDAVEFRALAEAGSWSAAAEYKGVLLAGSTLAGEEFEHWLREQRDIVSGLQIMVLEQLAPQQQGEARVATAKRLLALDPLREASHRVVMAAYAEAGETALALKQYEACREILKRELGVAPAPQTEELRRTIASGPGKKAPQPQRAPLAKPGVAVLPFTALGAAPEQQHLCDGIVGDIISALSRFRAMTVTARGASFAFRDAALGPADVGAKLGVDYLVAGSLRVAEARLRLSVELIDVATETVIWAQSYARELADLFSLQDDVASTIAAAVTGQVESDIATRAAKARSSNPAAYDLALSALQHLQHTTRKNVALALDRLAQAIALDPGYAEAYPWLASALLLIWQFDYDRPALTRAIDVAQQGTDLDPVSARCQMMLGYCLLASGERVRSEWHHRRALALNPGDPYIIANYGLLEAYMGRPEECDRCIDEALRLNPYPPSWYEEFRLIGAFVAGKYEQARAGFEHAPDTYWDRLYLLSCYGHLRLRQEAADQMDWFRARFPILDLTEAARIEPFWREEDRARLIEGIEKAVALARGNTVVKLERRT